MPQRPWLEAMKQCSRCLVAFLMMTCLMNPAWAAAAVSSPEPLLRDADTGLVFPASISFARHGSSYRLTLTGLAVRTKLFFNVYCLAHYMQDPPTRATGPVFKTILSDGHAKQVTMHFVRDVSAEKIQRALLEGFQRNADDAELEAIQPFIDQFARAIHRDVKEDDQFVIRWLPGGMTTSIFEGREVTTITSVLFARVLWSIWFGEHSVVNRDQLVRFLVAES